MIGAIIGDIAGSRFEFKPIKSKDFELIILKNHITKYKKFVIKTETTYIGKTIVNVYQVQKWQQAQDRYGEKGVGRIEFVGVEAPSEIKNFFIGKKFLNIYQNPVYYLSDKTILI